MELGNMELFNLLYNRSTFILHKEYFIHTDNA